MKIEHKTSEDEDGNFNSWTEISDLGNGVVLVEGDTQWNVFTVQGSLNRHKSTDGGKTWEYYADTEVAG